MDAVPMSFSPRWLLAGLLLFFVALSVHYTFKVSHQEESRSAILRWRNQILSMQDGEDIYERYTYPNPPIMALILTPVVQWPDLVGLPHLAAALGWFYLKVAMSLLVFHWIFKLVEDPERPFPLGAKVLTAVLAMRPLMGDLSHGNVNIFILFLVTAGLYAFHCRRDLLGGVLLALAISCKVTPALFVPYLVWKRAWRALAGVAVGMMLFFWPGLIPASFLGWQENREQLGSWVKQMVQPYVIQGVVTSEHNNQSLPGLLYRLTTHSPSFSTYINDQYTPTQWHNVVTWSHETARWLVKGCMGLFVLLIVWTCSPRWRSAGEHPSHRAAEYALVLLGMLLFSERTWKHHCVTLVLPFAVLSYSLFWSWSDRPWRGILVGTLTTVSLLMATTSTSLLGYRLGKLAQVYGAYVAAFLVLLGALAVFLRRPAAGSLPASLPLTTSEYRRRAG